MLLFLLLFFCIRSLHGQGLFSFHVFALLYSFHVFGLLIILYLGNSITFSPNGPLCIGEQVEMICYIVPPPSTTFALTAAFVSFDGSSPAANLAQINTNSIVGGIDLTRYSANTDELGVTTSRPGIRLIISSYIPSDSNTIYGCHGLFPNTSISEALVSDTPMGQASLLKLIKIS